MTVFSPNIKIALMGLSRLNESYKKGCIVNTRKSAGHLSQVIWESKDLQVQTEVRYGEEPVLTTIMVEDGIVVYRAKKLWSPLPNPIEDQNKISDYHNRLTSAISKLRDKAWIKSEELPDLAEKLVNLALKYSGGSMAVEAVDVIPGARWTAIINRKGEVLEAAPDATYAQHWGPLIPHFDKIFKEISNLFSAGELGDISIKLPKSYGIMAPDSNNNFLLTEVSIDNLGEARPMINKLVKG